MERSLPLAQGVALRALAEGAEPTLALLADASQRSLNGLVRRAAKEGWKIGCAPPANIAERVRSTAALLIDRLEAAGREALANGGRIDKTEIDGLVSIIRGLERIGDLVRPEEAARENQIRSDEELAALLGRINERIVELARAFANDRAFAADMGKA
ncbi:MAG: hypothetical protein ACTHJQ_20760 [Rhizobiaceae bacterium]|nr:hypothetical protein [Hyphomicrobiales bacterium]